MPEKSPLTTPLDVEATLRGRHILFTGATGFVGKVALSMLLERYPEVGGVHVLVRPGSGGDAHDRFFSRIAPSEPFQPLRDRYGDAGAKKFLEEKCHIHAGDVTDPLWGIDPSDVEALKGQIAAVINCAGLVSFDPSLEIGIDVNVGGVQHGVELALALGAPLVHVSTCFVAGNRTEQGQVFPGRRQVFEDEEVLGYFPKQNELARSDFDVDTEVEDCRKLVAQARERADDRRLAAQFRTDAVARLESEGRDPADPKALRLAMGRERKLWLMQELTRIGMDRAQSWGWPNTYTYTKSLGEQVMAKAEARGLRWCSVRPSIVESALRYPFPGWNEGFTTSAPLTFLALKGQRQWPANPHVVLDIIPVDLVAGAIIAATAASICKEQKRVYQLASSDVNPLLATRVVELTGLYRRKYYRNKEGGTAVSNAVQSRLEPKSVSLRQFQATSAPLLHGLAKKAKSLIDAHQPTWGAPKVSALLERATLELDEIEAKTRAVSAMVDVFKPFIWENRTLFRSDATRALYARLAPADVAKIPWDPHQYLWREYWMNVHMPGMEKWVYPGLETESKKRVHTVKTHRDLLELFEASVAAHRNRTALRMFRGEDRERFTFGQMHDHAQRVARFLVAQGVQRGDRVMLCSENRPEWPISYFGILMAGGTAVPVDSALSEGEVLNLARSCGAKLCVVSQGVIERLPALEAALHAAGVPAQVATLSQALAGGPACKLLKNGAPDDVASLIFTSGTTGNPKAVMLTHRNFASLVAKLAGVFEKLGVGDGVLSVLPLHHTFEFTCGMLLPLSRGAEITYLDELTSDRLGDALESANVTAMIGVPALWQLLHRKITQELAAKPGVVEQASKALMGVNAGLRNRLDLNLGKLLFWPVHRKLGGKLKYLVSGGSALSPEVHEAFHAMGFDIAEGYGLTESSPVLTVTPVQNKRIAGSVGRALTGIEIQIAEPDAQGIGEVLAKGPSVMSGYFENREATAAVLKDGWLHTGDLGRLDEDGQLYLVGRKKDVIIDANGKNVYPDELEELYGKHDFIKELSIVGLPEVGGVGEKVACLCVPDYGDEPRDAVRRALEAHFRSISSGMPFYRRVKVVHLWDGILPRTSTRKVKRKQVIDELQRLERISLASTQLPAESARASGDAWLFDLIAEVAQKPRGSVSASTRLSDLGFDSLMLTELSVGLEAAGVPLPAIEDLSDIQTVAELAKVVKSAHRRQVEFEPPEPEEAVETGELVVPDVVAQAGRKLLGLGQRILYDSLFDVRVHGRNYVPKNRNFLVIANHTSHLDMGLVKMALGEEGERLVALAARDYFFDNPAKRAYFENFTNLIPMDRQGSLRESLALAGQALDQGYHLLVFPEGTRSQSGELQGFKPTIGYLALQHGVDIVPMYIEGAFEALPKGALLPRAKSLTVRIGPRLRVDVFRDQVAGLAKSEGYRVLTRAAEDSVRALAQGKVLHGLAPASTPRMPRKSTSRQRVNGHASAPSKTTTSPAKSRKKAKGKDAEDSR